MAVGRCGCCRVGVHASSPAMRGLTSTYRCKNHPCRQHGSTPTTGGTATVVHTTFSRARLLDSKNHVEPDLRHDAQKLPDLYPAKSIIAIPRPYSSTGPQRYTRLVLYHPPAPVRCLPGPTWRNSRTKFTACAGNPCQTISGNPS